MLFARWHVFTILLIVAWAVTFREPSARILCDDPPVLQTTNSCVKLVPGNTELRKAQYEFSKRTLRVMHQIASGTQSPIKAEVAEIQQRMQRRQTNGVGFFYDVLKRDNVRHNSDCNIYARSGRGSLDRGNVVYTIGAQDCDNEAVALLILYGRAIDHLTTRRATLTPKYYYSKHPNIQIASNCAVTPYSEILSILTYHQITREQLIAASSKISIEVIEVTTPTVEYTVSKGDTMYGIAQRATGVGDNWQAIWAVNPKIANPGKLKVGRTIHIPPSITNWKAMGRKSTDYAATAKRIYGDSELAGWVQSLEASSCGVSGNMRHRLVPTFDATRKYRLRTLWLPRLKISK